MAERAGATDMTRREILRRAGVTSGTLVGGVALAACSGGGEEPAATSGAGQGTGGGTDGVVVPLADVPVGGAVSATIDGQEVLVTQPVEGEIHAFSAICTHQGCTVAPGDGELACPCHGSRYALTDAAVLAGPAPEPLPEIAVVVDGDDVVTS
ncbi:Rieske (2Fe-2S) protein [Myceligenerans pegani]|uniref:Cytochrome bc1 complex Rieske iron-sulfur subunit n=1 Tax=Myceligenerans pegani TaxID=2776917 RepID=A0ABR9MZF8_9MICO|nr:Rieske (2Fe-2S) protein [Myceligenerans sp. TRM 65318]MBE1876475.1 Rieske (2Fe-2S) protein [Myceligenerans sp. TRM 65318]MBE3018746.1 Rieske (2Fe-2S) protein [Myceligenerans sp. TRM 65318]